MYFWGGGPLAGYGSAMRNDPAFADHDLIAAARRVADIAAKHVDKIESEQRLPESVLRAATEAGLFRLYLPASVGGPEVDPFSTYRAIEELARVDGSLGWIAMLSTTLTYLTSWLPHEVVASMRTVDGDLRIAGSSRPLGTARREGGGYRVDGRWDYASGIEHATWVMAMCNVVDGEHAGTVRAMFVRPADIEIVRVWDVMGLRGTGSHDIVASNVWVAADYTCSFGGPLPGAPLLYHPRLMRVSAQAPTAAVNVGIALGLLDAFSSFAAGAATTGSPTVLRERRAVQAAFGEATAIVESTRAFVMDSVAESWTTVTDGLHDPTATIARARLSFAQAARDTLRAADLLFTAAGTAGVFRSIGIERRVRDLHVARLFKSYDDAVVEDAGRVFLGLAPRSEGW